MKATMEYAKYGSVVSVAALFRAVVICGMWSSVDHGTKNVVGDAGLFSCGASTPPVF